MLSSMAGYVGLDPNRDIDWIVIPSAQGAMERFATGKVDAFLGFPPEPQALRARGIHDVIVKTATDKPWSQYYRCMLYSHPDFVGRYPAATKRVVRAVLKAADLCVREPEWAAREIVDKGYVQNYDFALETLALDRPGSRGPIAPRADSRGLHRKSGESRCRRTRSRSHARSITRPDVRPK